MFLLLEKIQNTVRLVTFCFVFLALFSAHSAANVLEQVIADRSISVPIKDVTSNFTIDKKIGSAFLVLYKNRVFLITNAHVILRAGVTNQLAFQHNSRWYRIQTQWSFTGKIDVSAVEVTSQIPNVIVGKFRIDSEELEVNETVLTALCNPDLFTEPFVGTYTGIRDQQIEIKFIGKGLKPYCSGSPLLDRNLFIRGIITSGSIDDSDEVKWGYAIPSIAITRFLDEKFFP